MLTPGSQAPPIDLPIAASAGKRARLADKLSNGAVLVVFFKAECPTCKLAFPILERIWKRLRAVNSTSDLLVVGQNHSSEIPSFATKYGATFPIATEDEPFAVSDAYEITNVPSMFLVDEHGVILKTATGFARKEYDAIAADLTSQGRASLTKESGGLASLFTEADTALPALQPG